MSYKVSRRRFLEATGGALGLAAFARSFEALAQPQVPIRRLLIIQRPVGTVYENWWPEGTGTSFELSRILTQFAAHRERMVVLRDLNLPSNGSVGGGHERGSVLMLTGARTVELYPGNGGDDPMAEGASIDQLFVEQSPMLQGPPLASLQLSCDSRADTPEVSTRHMSYSGPRAPMRPYYQPLDAYMRVFGTLVPGGTTAGNMDLLARARAQKKSVLDFAKKDLARLRTLAPSAAREHLDAHEAAIRALELELDADPRDPVACGIASAPETVNISTQDPNGDPYAGDHTSGERDDVKHDRIAQLHFAVARAAFSCDLTRVVTLQFSPGTNHVSFGDLWPPNPSVFKIHHTTSHDPDSPDTLEFLTRVEEWYAARVSGWLTELAATQDLAGGTLLDTTLVPYVTEVGARYHNWDNMPFVLFGGAQTGLITNQVWSTGGAGARSTNDLWMACAGAFGLPDFVLGDNDQHTTALGGLFV
jgi:hypothetical protein